MGIFNRYAEEVNAIAKEAFAEYRKAEAAYKKAEEYATQYPHRDGIVNAEYAAKSARAQADLLDAKAAFKKAKSTFSSRNSDIAALRKQLAAEIGNVYTADPAALDSNTLELMKAGILKPNEFAKLMNEAQLAGNFTMARMIAKYAEEAAKVEGQRNGENSEGARTLRAISYAGSNNNGDAALGAFDLMAEVFNRATNNPAMIDHWEQLTAQAAESL